MFKIAFLFVLLMITTSFLASGAKLYDRRCPRKRPQVCTKEYKPVCGYTDIQCFVPPCPNYQTYGNACTACSDPTVLGYSAGACVCGPYRPAH